MVGPRTFTRFAQQRRHWALTDSRPCANVRRFIHRLAHLARKIALPQPRHPRASEKCEKQDVS